MNLYVDSSVLLRLVLGEPGRLRQWKAVKKALSSEIIRLECLRTLDRARLRLGRPDEEIAQKRVEVRRRLEAFDLVRLDGVVLDRAADPFPTLVGSLDAIHLASAILVRTRIPDVVFATHDQQLGMAARACGFGVVGV